VHVRGVQIFDQIEKCVPEVAGVTFSDSDSAPILKVLNPGPDSKSGPDPGPEIFQIWESDPCSDSGYNHRSNHNLPMFLLKKRPHRLLLLPKLKSDCGSGSRFSKIVDSGPGSERKTQNPAVPPLVCTNIKKVDSHCCRTTWWFFGRPRPKIIFSAWPLFFVNLSKNSIYTFDLLFRRICFALAKTLTFLLLWIRLTWNWLKCCARCSLSKTCC